VPLAICYFEVLWYLIRLPDQLTEGQSVTSSYI